MSGGMFDYEGLTTTPMYGLIGWSDTQEQEMFRYTFRHYDDTRTTVDASDEKEARYMAMVKRWGHAALFVINPTGVYEGRGLELEKKEDRSPPYL